MNFPPQQVSLYECRYENGYDLYYPDYIEWLRQVHPDSLPATSPGVSIKLAHPLKTQALKTRKQAHPREFRRCQLLYLHHPILLKDQATMPPRHLCPIACHKQGNFRLHCQNSCTILIQVLVRRETSTARVLTREQSFCRKRKSKKWRKQRRDENKRGQKESDRNREGTQD